MKNILLFTFIFATSLSFAQKCPCAEGAYRDFDFWIGEWNVYDTAGTKVGENLIYLQQDSCVIQENWTSKNSTGTSYNYFNKTDSTWNQVWIDNQGGSLVLKGNKIGSALTMKSELVPGQQIDFYYNQITWTPNSDGSVTQVWEVFSKDDQLLTELFRGVYRRKP